MIVLRHRAGLALATLALLGTGCSGSTDDAPERSETSGSAPSATSSPETGAGSGAESESAAEPELPKAPPLTKTQGATEDVTLRGSCGLEPGEQDIGGRVKNPTGRSLDYVITVSWISDDGRVRGRAVASIDDVPPGAKRPWSATAEVADDATACVTNALRGRAGS